MQVEMVHVWTCLQERYYWNQMCKCWEAFRYCGQYYTQVGIYWSNLIKRTLLLLLIYMRITKASKLQEYRFMERLKIAGNLLKRDAIS